MKHLDWILTACSRCRLLAGAVFVFAVGGLAPSSALAQTDVSGSVSGTQTWTASGSPYVLTDNATVTAGASLTIEPGVTVESTGAYRLNVQGLLSAVGTAADPITLSLGDGLAFYPGSAGSEVAWATIENSQQFGIQTVLANSQYAPWPSVHNDQFLNDYMALYAWYPSQGSASVSNSLFDGNSYGPLGVGGSISLDRVLIEDTSYQGINVSNNPGENWTITNSDLLPTTSTGCGYGTPGCTVFVQGGGYSITATGDWWGTTNTSQINSMIYDSNDDPSLSTVNYGPVANAPYDLFAPNSAPGFTSGTTLDPDARSLSGSASDSGAASSGIQQVQVSLTDTTAGTSWDGSQWVSGEHFRTASGTTNWQVTIPVLTEGHVYRVRTLAEDNAGNMQWGATSAMFTAQLPAPVVGSPGDGSYNDSGTVVLSGSAEANSTVTVYDGSQSVGTASADGSGAWSKTLSGVSDGSHAYKATATDAAGNTGPGSGVVHVTVDTQPPAAPVVGSPENGAHYRQGVTVQASYSCKDNADGSGIASCTGTVPGGHAIATSTLGLHRFTVTATDMAGNEVSRTVSYTVDATPPPTTRITSRQVKQVRRTATFSFSGSGGVGSLRFQCKLDAGKWTACVSPKSYTRLKRATHTFEVRAIDSRGRADLTPAGVTFTI